MSHAVKGGPVTTDLCDCKSLSRRAQGELCCKGNSDRFVCLATGNLLKGFIASPWLQMNNMPPQVTDFSPDKGSCMAAVTQSAPGSFAKQR